jgi:hypothetical protein
VAIALNLPLFRDDFRFDSLAGMKLLLPLCFMLLLAGPAERKRENPIEHLPQNIEVLTHFGERADISADNQRVGHKAMASLIRERRYRGEELGCQVAEVMRDHAAAAVTECLLKFAALDHVLARHQAV